MSQKIFITLSTFAEYGNDPLRLLEESSIPFSVNSLGRRLKPEDVLELAADATGIVAGVEPYDQALLEKLPRLKCISRCGVGTDAIDHEFARARGITIRNTPDVVTQPVAELAVAMIFDLCRHLTTHTLLLKNRQWKKYAGRLVSKQTIGVLGLGRIGRRTAEILRALGVRVLGCDLKPDAEWAASNGITLTGLDDLLEKSDIVTLHLPSPENGQAIINPDTLSKMKTGALLVNTSRGNLVDETALADALTGGKLGGAALDVFSVEPYDGPLCDLDNVVFTPHVATLTLESRLQMETESVENLLQELHD